MSILPSCFIPWIEGFPGTVFGATCGKTHIVASGEGCWSIYTDSKLTQAQFLGINPGLDCNLLQVGQQVCVSVSCSKFYTVVSGDWCAKIESEQGVSDADLMTLNPGLNCNEIFAGQSICIAAPAATTTRATTSVVQTSTAVVTSTQPTSTAVPTPSTIECGRSVPVSQGDTCYDLATANGLQLPQFEAMNQGLNCSALQAGDIACLKISCGEIYKVSSPYSLILFRPNSLISHRFKMVTGVPRSRPTLAFRSINSRFSTLVYPVPTLRRRIMSVSNRPRRRT